MEGSAMEGGKEADMDDEMLQARLLEALKPQECRIGQ